MGRLVVPVKTGEVSSAEFLPDHPRGDLEVTGQKRLFEFFDGLGLGLAPERANPDPESSGKLNRGPRYRSVVRYEKRIRPPGRAIDADDFTAEGFYPPLAPV